MVSHDAAIDRLARLLAAGAGIDWNRLGEYPGYTRYYWREQAQAMHAALTGDAAPPPPARA